MATTNHVSPLGGVVLGGTAPVTFTAGSTSGQVAANIQVLWDFDNDGDWSESVEDITSYVLSLETSSGRDYPSHLTGRSGPGKLRMTLNNDDDRFSYFNTLSPLNTSPFSLKTGRRVRVEVTDPDRGAATITYVGIGAASTGDNTSLTPALPTGLVESDLMVILASIRNSGTGTVDTPDGWAPIPDEDGTPLVSGNVALLGRYYETGDTAPTVTFTGGVAGATTLAQCFALRGTIRTLSDVVSGSVMQLNGSAQDIAYPAQTISAANQAVVILGWKQDDWTSVAALAGMTEISDTTTTTGNDASHAIDYVIQTTATNISSGSFTVTGGASAISRSMVVAFKPATDATDPVLLARDRFERAETPILGSDELGTAWSTVSGGGYGIVNGMAVARDGYGASTSTNIISVLDVGTTDHYVQCSVPNPTQNGRVGLVLRYKDASNYTRVYLDAGSSGGITVEDVEGGAATDLHGGSFLIEFWDGMTLGAAVVNQAVKVYVGGTELDFGSPLLLSRDIDGTKCGIYGYWTSGSDVPPAVDDFYAWDRVAEPLDGVNWTGYVKEVRTSVSAGDLKVVEVAAEGPLAAVATTEVPAPRIPRRVGEYDNGTNHSVPAGCIVGDIMARAGHLHPPQPLAANPLSHIGSVAIDDGKALEVARAIEVTENGFIKETPEGQIAFEDRDYRASLSSQAWFTDTSGTGQYGYSSIEPLDHQSQIVNRVVARVAPTPPTVAATEFQTDSGASLDVGITIPTVRAGDLLVVAYVTSVDNAGDEHGCPPPWKELRKLRQEEGNGLHINTLICDGSESGDTVYFFKSSQTGSFAARLYTIRNWYGSDDGVLLGRVTRGTNPYPIAPGWGRQPTLYVVIQGAIGAGASSLSYAGSSVPPPIGYDADTRNGIILDHGTNAHDTGVATIRKVDCTDVEDPRDWPSITNGLIYDTCVLAIRGYNGPLQAPTADDPKATRGSSDGLTVRADDIDSQLEHNIIRTNPDIPTLHYREGDAVHWCTDVLDTYADDRPIIGLSFYASKDSRLRTQAVRRRVSDKVTVTATGNAGLGITGQFHIEHINHRWSNGTRLWETRWELSPA